MMAFSPDALGCAIFIILRARLINLFYTETAPLLNGNHEERQIHSPWIPGSQDSSLNCSCWKKQFLYIINADSRISTSWIFLSNRLGFCGEPPSQWSKPGYGWRGGKCIHQSRYTQNCLVSSLIHILCTSNNLSMPPNNRYIYSTFWRFWERQSEPSESFLLQLGTLWSGLLNYPCLKIFQMELRK